MFSFFAGVPLSWYTENVGPNPGQGCFNFYTGTVPLLPGKQLLMPAYYDLIMI